MLQGMSGDQLPPLAGQATARRRSPRFCGLISLPSAPASAVGRRGQYGLSPICWRPATCTARTGVRGRVRSVAATPSQPSIGDRKAKRTPPGPAGVPMVTACPGVVDQIRSANHQHPR